MNVATCSKRKRLSFTTKIEGCEGESEEARSTIRSTQTLDIKPAQFARKALALLLDNHEGFLINNHALIAKAEGLCVLANFKTENRLKHWTTWYSFLHKRYNEMYTCAEQLNRMRRVREKLDRSILPYV